MFPTIKKIPTRAVDIPSGCRIELKDFGVVEVLETRFNLKRQLVFLRIRTLPGGTLTEYVCGPDATVVRLMYV